MLLSCTKQINRLKTNVMEKQNVKRQSFCIRCLHSGDGRLTNRIAKRQVPVAIV